MLRRPVVAALVLAAGRGTRLGAAVPKAFVLLEGQTLLERSIRALAATGRIERLVPVVSRHEMPGFAAIGIRCADLASLASAVAGGDERQDSMQAGLASLPKQVEFVAVHDAARCLVDPADVERVLEVAAQTGAAILGEPVRDTLKRVVDGRIVETPDRAELWAAQTPQVFRRDWLEAATAAAAKSGRRATDDASLVEALGHAVTMVEARAPNPKITRPEDLVFARVLLAQREERAAAGSVGAGAVYEPNSQRNRG